MSRRPSNVVRTSLYHLVGIDELRTAVRGKYFDAPYDFDALEATIEGVEALLVTGEMETDKAKWTGTVEDLVGSTINLGNKTAAAALLIRDGKGNAWALTYGMGFQVLDQDYFDAGFGQRIALRSVDVSALSSLTRTTLDTRSRVDRLSIPSGDHLRNFGLSNFGELITRVVARAHIDGLTDSKETLTLRGAEALQLPLARKPKELISDLGVLSRLLEKPALPGLELLEQVTLVKHDPALIAELDARLEGALTNPNSSRIGLAWPHEQLDENNVAVSYRVQGAGRGNGGPFDELPTFEDLVSLVTQAPAPKRLAKLKQLKIVLFSEPDADDYSAASSAIPAIKWVAFETDIGKRRYFLHNGSWYLVDQQYMERLKQQTKDILSRDPGFTMPDWTTAEADEKAYNTMAAKHMDALNLDRKLIRTDMHRHGIEPCDLLLKDGTLIHVKNLRGSDVASHQIAQALVSADALLHDDQARDALGRRIKDASFPKPSAQTPKRVVLAMARDGEITEDTLFTFTQVTLVRNVQALSNQGVDVFVAPIRRTP